MTHPGPVVRLAGHDFKVHELEHTIVTLKTEVVDRGR